MGRGHPKQGREGKPGSKQQGGRRRVGGTRHRRRSVGEGGGDQKAGPGRAGLARQAGGQAGRQAGSQAGSKASKRKQGGRQAGSQAGNRQAGNRQAGNSQAGPGKGQAMLPVGAVLAQNQLFPLDPAVSVGSGCFSEVPPSASHGAEGAGMGGSF